MRNRIAREAETSKHHFRSRTAPAPEITTFSISCVFHERKFLNFPPNTWSPVYKWDLAQLLLAFCHLRLWEQKQPCS